MAKSLTSMDICEVNLNEGNRDRGQGIPNRNAGVGKGRRVNQDVANAPAGSRMNVVDHGAFVVRLERLDFYAEGVALRLQQAIDFRERGGTVDLRFPHSQPI